MTVSPPTPRSADEVLECLFKSESWLSNRAQACPERVAKLPEKAASAPNSRAIPLLGSLPCQSLALLKALDPFVLRPIPNVSRCPLATQVLVTSHHHRPWGSWGRTAAVLGSCLLP